MSARHRKVILHHQEALSLVEGWINHLAVKRRRRGVFAVYCNQYGQDPDTGTLGWGEGDTSADLESPLAIAEAIDAAARLMSIELDWPKAIASLATLDWVTAAVIAFHRGLPIPPLPDVAALKSQRILGTLGTVCLRTSLHGYWQAITIPCSRWIAILRGEPAAIKGRFCFEGKRYRNVWDFKGGLGLEILDANGGTAWLENLTEADEITGREIDGCDLAAVALAAAIQSNAPRLG